MARPLLQLTLIRPWQKFRAVFGLKRPSMSFPNLFFAKPLPKLPSLLLFSIIGIGKRRQDVLPVPLLPYFTTPAFYLFLKVKPELASCLLTHGTFEKSM
jgi:hypothetical protein